MSGVLHFRELMLCRKSSLEMFGYLAMNHDKWLWYYKRGGRFNERGIYSNRLIIAWTLRIMLYEKSLLEMLSYLAMVSDITTEEEVSMKEVLIAIDL